MIIGFMENDFSEKRRLRTRGRIVASIADFSCAERARSLRIFPFSKVFEYRSHVLWRTSLEIIKPF